MAIGTELRSDLGSIYDEIEVTELLLQDIDTSEMAHEIAAQVEKVASSIGIAENYMRAVMDWVKEQEEEPTSGAG